MPTIASGSLALASSSRSRARASSRSTATRFRYRTSFSCCGSLPSTLTVHVSHYVFGYSPRDCERSQSQTAAALCEDGVLSQREGRAIHESLVLDRGRFALARRRKTLALRTCPGGRGLTPPGARANLVRQIRVRRHVRVLRIHIPPSPVQSVKRRSGSAWTTEASLRNAPHHKRSCSATTIGPQVLTCP